MRKSHFIIIAIFWSLILGLAYISWAENDIKKSEDSKKQNEETLQLQEDNLLYKLKNIYIRLSALESYLISETDFEGTETRKGKLSPLTFIRDDTAFITVYATLTGNDTVSIWKDLQIIQSIPKIKNIKVFMDCWGGSVYAGFAVADNFVRIKDKYNLSIHASGVIASAAVVIFASFEKRYASPNSFFMVHEAALGDSAAGMNAQDIKMMDKLLDLFKERYINILVNNSNISKDEWMEKIKETTWFSAEKAYKWGLVTEVK